MKQYKSMCAFCQYIYYLPDDVYSLKSIFAPHFKRTPTAIEDRPKHLALSTIKKRDCRKCSVCAKISITVENSDYSDAEKYIFLGLLLKKRRPKKLDKRVLGITHSQESLEKKIEMMLELDEMHKKVKDVKEERQKHGKEKIQVRRRGRRKKKPDIFVIDPSGDIYDLLQNSLLRKRVLFRKLGDSANDIDLINEVKPDLLIINQTHSLRHFTLEINQLLKPSISLIILSWGRAGDFYGSSTRRVIRFFQKPLNVTLFEKAIRELTG